MRNLRLDLIYISLFVQYILLLTDIFTPNFL